MSKENQSDKQTASNTTTFSGPVTAGAISTGSGSITIGSQTFGVQIASTKDEFLANLLELKDTIRAAQEGENLPRDVADDAIIEIEAAEFEVKKDNPKSERILKRLSNAKEILTQAAKVVGATTAVATAVTKLIPFVEVAIQSVNKLF